MKQKLIVWDLFGGGQNSVYNTLKDNPNYEIYTFDVVKPQRDKQFIIDLTLPFEDLINYFNLFPKPDIIVSSPLCQSFSIVLQFKGGGTCFWKYEDVSKTKLIERTIEEFETLKVQNGFTKKLNAEKQLFIKRVGEKCINNTLSLIDYYKPKYFYIENPKTSLMWNYIKYNTNFLDDKEHFFNKTRYGNYGFIARKDTIFLSNTQMNLKWEPFNPPYIKETINGRKYYTLKDTGQKVLGSPLEFLRKDRKKVNHFSTLQTSEAGKASHIPSGVIKDIFKHFI